MASLIANCLGKLVATKRISQKAADAALALHEGMQGRLGREMPPTHADAAAAIEAARAMAEAAKRRKFAAAQNAIRLAEGRNRMAAHPKGKAAGLNAMLSRDVWETGAGANLESHIEVVEGFLFRRAGKFLEAHKSRLAGFKAETVGIRNTVRELHGRDTGDPLAKEAAAAWMGATEAGFARVRQAGKTVAHLDEWRLPQFWESSRVRAAPDAWERDVLAAAEAGGLTVMDKAGGGPAPATMIPAIVRKAREEIIAGEGSGGASRAFNEQMRVFRFNDPETWLKLQETYGPGKGGIYQMMLGHLRGMANEIALAEFFGPNHRGVFNTLLGEARREFTATATGGKRVVAGLAIDNPASAEIAFRYLSGDLSIPKSELTAGIFGGLRSLQTAANLGSAVVSAVPGDTVTATLASMHNGLAPTRVLARALSEIASDPAKREIAAQMQIVSHAIMDSVVAAKRFEDQVVGENLPGRLASAVIRVSGLQAWTEGLKRAFMMEFNGMIAREAARDFGRIDPDFRRFLERYGFTAAEWDVIRAAEPMEVNGARFLDPEKIADRKIADRLLGAMLDERSFAVVEPGARTRVWTTGGVQRGSIPGEIWRSSFLFKSFAISVMMTHVMRAVATGPVWSRPIRLAAFMATMAVGGAAALQAKQIIAGRDPRDMGTVDFWMASFFQGGGAGIYGDFLYSAASRSGFGPAEAAAGPLLGEAFNLLKLTAGNAGEAATGKKTNVGAEIARFVKRWTPGSTLWYTRLATDRLIFDQIQAMADPDYRKAFRRTEQRMKRDFDQRFWWRPGRTAPDRGPDLGAALP